MSVRERGITVFCLRSTKQLTKLLSSHQSTIYIESFIRTRKENKSIVQFEKIIMSKFIAKIAEFFSKRTMVGMDKAGNRYFTGDHVIDGVTKEKRWVIFKGEEDPTSVPVEWICWLNGQRKRAPTPEEMAELEARREFVRQNVERLKKEEQGRRAMQGNVPNAKITGKVGGPDLRSFLRQVQKPEGSEPQEASEAGTLSEGEPEKEEIVLSQETSEPRTTEPTGSGPSFKPGTWQPPS